jgi:hypothetical protein
VFVRARTVNGPSYAFSDECRWDGAARDARWRLAGQGCRTVAVPAGEADRLESALAALDSELRRPTDSQPQG